MGQIHLTISCSLALVSVIVGKFYMKLETSLFVFRLTAHCSQSLAYVTYIVSFYFYIKEINEIEYIETKLPPKNTSTTVKCVAFLNLSLN